MQQQTQRKQCRYLSNCSEGNKMKREFWVVLRETDHISLGLLQKANALAQEHGLDLFAVLVKTSISSEEARDLSAYGAIGIYQIHADPTDPSVEHSTAVTLMHLAKEKKPLVILFEYSVFSGSVAPQLAVLLECGITADCTDLLWDEKRGLLLIRPSFGGNRLAVNCSLQEPYLATVRRGVFPCLHAVYTPVDIPIYSISLKDEKKQIRLVEALETSIGVQLEDAKIVLSGGLGMGSRENFQMLFHLGKLLNVPVGASRAAVASGYASYRHQVGQTGVTISPEVYIAFGISGAVQHLSGILNAKKIIAVNLDPDAPIHRYSDYSVYTDCVAFIEELIKRMSRSTE